MTLKEHIVKEVNKTFQDDKERKMVKVYLFFWMLKHPVELRHYHRFEIGLMLGITPNEVKYYLKGMEKESNRKKPKLGFNRKYPFLSDYFETKFDNVEKACTGYAEILRLQELSEAQDRAYNSVKTTREINIEYYLN